MLIEPEPPHASFALPWDAADAPPPVRALREARHALGDTFSVESGATRYLFVFDSPNAVTSFVDNGWDASASAAAGAGTGTSAANVGAGAGNVQGGRMYSLTKAGLQAGGAVSGLKAWKDKDLN